MTETTQLPVWLVAVLTVVPALIAGASAVLAAWLVDDDRLVALSVLDALNGSKPSLLQAEELGILDAVLDAVLSEPTLVVEEYRDETGRYEVEVTGDG